MPNDLDSGVDRRNHKILTLSLAMTLVATTVFTALTAPITQAHEVDPNEAVKSTESDEFWDCHIEATPSPLVLRLQTDIENLTLDQDDDLVFVATNSREQEGRVWLAGTVFSEEGSASYPRLVAARVSAEGQAELRVPMEALQLPRQGLDFSGRISLVATVDYLDGARDAIDRSMVLFFHPTQGGWLLYDDVALVERYQGGGLSPGARALLAQSNGAAGPALFEAASSSPSWRPLPEGLPEPIEAELEMPPIEPDWSLLWSDWLKICIRQYSTYVDAGVGEDYWQNNWSTDRDSRGSFVEIFQDTAGTLLWSGYLGDGIGMSDPGSGCTDTFSVPAGDYVVRVEIESRGQVRGNDVVVQDPVTGSHHRYAISLFRPANLIGTWNLIIDPASTHKEFNIYMALAYGLYRHAGGLRGETFTALSDQPDGSAFDSPTDTLKINPNHDQKKFLILHEMGHAVGDFATGNSSNKLVGLPCPSYESPTCPASGGSHSMGSKEYSRCALGDGFAHFYAASVFNNNNETDCYFHYYKNEFGNNSTPLVNCESANGGFDLKYMETNCPAPWDGYGTELDWLRTLWDVHTNNPSPPGFPEILQWLADADAWGDFDAFDRLDDEANEMGGTLDVNWDFAADYNGVDH